MEGLAETKSPTRPRRKKKRKRGRKIAIGLFVIAVALAGFFVYRALRSTGNAPLQYTTQAAQLGTIIQSVSGTGSVNLNNSQSVTSKVSGTVAGLKVAVGDKVTEGQVLFSVTNDSLDTAVTQATNSYQQALSSLESAELNLEKAQQSLSDLQDEYSKERSDPNSSAQSLSVRQVSLNVTPPSTTTTTDQPTAATQQSSTTTESTISDLDIKIAEQQVTSSQLAVSVAQTNVTLAQMSLDTAKQNVTYKEVTSPIAGTITALNVADGDSVTASSSSGTSSTTGNSNNAPVVVTDLGAWDVSVTLSETDVSSVKVGQKASLTFDALPDVSLTGKVTSMDVMGTNSSGVVSYTATITPDAGNESILGGMTVTVDIVTQVAANVLTVPNAAVKTASDGSYYVQILQNGQPTDVTVEIGLADDTNTEITSGLAEGQEVITRTVNPNVSTSTSSGRSTGGFGGGGFPSGGGGVFIGPGG